MTNGSCVVSVGLMSLRNKVQIFGSPLSKRKSDGHILTNVKGVMEV